ncbi:outer membrane beta-barrel protein [Ningiella sp. W23]|uniref:outer membrane beta-barrel protein n=1 Tax=Ningiella sp. W23 TaxID=3023715 RepID=UPI003756B607
MKFCFTKVIVISVCSLLVTFSVQAERSLYGIVAGGYVQNEVENYELDKASYKLGIGYEISPQWYIEGGFQSLGEENASDALPGIDSDIAEFSGLYLSALGKARGQFGELFYRVGAMRVDANIQSVDNLDCGEALCRFDESLMAGVIGAGFDFYVHHTTMMRFEVEYIRGEKDYSASAFYLGLRVNF